jgi:class 3 adenylate cyclase
MAAPRSADAGVKVHAVSVPGRVRMPSFSACRFHFRGSFQFWSLVRWRGVENDAAGDGFYATFDGPARAIRCATEVAERVQDLGIEIRAGVHTGECEIIDDKLGGITVSIGVRISALAGPSEVVVSQTVKDLVAGSGLTFEDAGEQELKGVPDRWHLYRVVG